MKKRLFYFAGAALLIAVAYLFYIKPVKVSCAYQPYYAQLNATLKSYRPGASAGVIDVDHLNHNIGVVKSQLGNRYKLRIVTKSLPSLPLLNYLMQQGNTNRLMVFSEPFIAEVLTNYNADTLDLLLGKPLPVDAAERLTALPGWAGINWLIDTRQRLNEYLALAQKKDTVIRISMEIDVGLHRGGFKSMNDFAAALETIKANSKYLQLTGLMGYDGHVPHVPFYINKDKAILNAFNDVQLRYTAFVDELKKHYEPDFINALVFNSGGSRTYFYYPQVAGTTPVNDIAMGSGFLSPAQFTELPAVGHQPALFLTSPVLKKINSAELPLAEKLSPLVNWWDPNLKVSYFMLGGGWPGDLVAPKGMQRNHFWDGDVKTYTNLLPNQSILSSSVDNNINVGDFVISQAWEGDGMLCFGKVLVYSNGRIIDEWSTYKGSN